MAEDRVKSKNLFNFRPAGAVDSDVLEKEKAMMEAMGMDMETVMEQMKGLTDEEYGKALQGMMEGICATLYQCPEYLEVRSVIIESLALPCPTILNTNTEPSENILWSTAEYSFVVTTSVGS